MPLTTEEQQRMQRFQKASQKIKNLNLVQDPKQIEEAITFYKERLKTKYKEMTRSELEKIFQKLTDLLTQRISTSLKNLEYIYTTIPDFLIEEETQKYLLANSKLITLKEKILENYGK